mmetsp:Transcript_6662/g.10057  ORF Transcript_6662/g.10057 Transcript_6662/m.10057 type:complete len:83 (-) Transcript_6662:114-362(-)
MALLSNPLIIGVHLMQHPHLSALFPNPSVLPLVPVQSVGTPVPALPLLKYVSQALHLVHTTHWHPQVRERAEELFDQFLDVM